jgi:hypothetical protein
MVEVGGCCYGRGMDWRNFSQVELQRLLAKPNEQENFQRELFEFLKRNGVPMSDPLVTETCATWERLVHLCETVEKLIRNLPRPYRPLVDPWQTRGLAAKLRADFEVGGNKRDGRVNAQADETSE